MVDVGIISVLDRPDTMRVVQPKLQDLSCILCLPASI